VSTRRKKNVATLNSRGHFGEGENKHAVLKRGRTHFHKENELKGKDIPKGDSTKRYARELTPRGREKTKEI